MTIPEKTLHLMFLVYLGCMDWLIVNHEYQISILSYITPKFTFNIDTSCTPIPTTKHASVNHRNASLGSRLTYVCDKGYRYADLSSTKEIECGQNLQWSGNVEDCHGTNISYTINVLQVSWLFAHGMHSLKYVSNVIIIPLDMAHQKKMLDK